MTSLLVLILLVRLLLRVKDFVTFKICSREYSSFRSPKINHNKNFPFFSFDFCQNKLY